MLTPREARALKPETRFIFTSGVANIELAIEVVKLGASDFLQKPLDISALSEAVDRVAIEILADADETGEFQPPDTGHMSDLPGYKVLRQIGVGAMGSVFLARQLTLDRPVAIKVIRPTAFKDAHALERFVLEARSSARMNPPNIIQTFDLVEHGGFLFLVMEYFPSVEISLIVKQTGRLPWQKALLIVRQMADALVHASSRGIVHRDVKPANILIGQNGLAKLADFGMARECLVAETTEEAGLEEKIFGTPAFLSPEQVRALPIVDVRSDIYSLGLCLFYMIEGRSAYAGPIPQVLEAQLHTPLPELTAPRVPQTLCQTLKKMTEKDPDERFESATELRNALRGVR